jgi:hypothetical protein
MTKPATPATAAIPDWIIDPLRSAVVPAGSGIVILHDKDGGWTLDGGIRAEARPAAPLDVERLRLAFAAAMAQGPVKTSVPDFVDQLAAAYAAATTDEEGR